MFFFALPRDKGTGLKSHDLGTGAQGHAAHQIGDAPVRRSASNANLDETETIGADDEDAIERPIAHQDRAALTSGIESVLKTYRISDAMLLREAAVSHHTLRALRGAGRVSQQSLLNLARAAEHLRRLADPVQAEHDIWRENVLREARRIGGVSRLAAQIGVTRQYLGRVLRGEKPVTQALASLVEHPPQPRGGRSGAPRPA